MRNQEIETTWWYHNGTKHPGGELLDPRHTFDPMRHPPLFKRYVGAGTRRLDLADSLSQTSALDAISTWAGPAGEQVPAFRDLSQILHYSAGITKMLKYPSGERPFRAAACTGALYHIELYLVCGDLEGLDAGVYHYDVENSSVALLRQGDYRAAIAEAAADRAVAAAPVVLIYTDVFWRNAVKYQAREYRHAFWDAGTIIANSLAISAAQNIPAKVILGYQDSTVNKLLGLDTEREAAVAMIALGRTAEPQPSAPPAQPLKLAVEPSFPNERRFSGIQEMHDASSLTVASEVRSWIERTPHTSDVALDDRDPSRPAIPLPEKSALSLPEDGIERVIVRRGSTRKFAQVPIGLDQLAVVVDAATTDLSADFLDTAGTTLVQPYLVANSVDGLPSGAYVLGVDSRDLLPLDQGDTRQIAGYLGLQQQLSHDASVNIFFLTDLDAVLERFGNRGYRAAQLEAAMRAGRVYIAAYAQGLGATGLTFFDDAVTSYFSPHAEGKSVMFMIAVGKKDTAG